MPDSSTSRSRSSFGSRKAEALPKAPPRLASLGVSKELVETRRSGGDRTPQWREIEYETFMEVGHGVRWYRRRSEPTTWNRSNSPRAMSQDATEHDFTTTCPTCGRKQRLDEALPNQSDPLEVVYGCMNGCGTILIVSTHGIVAWEGRARLNQKRLLRSHRLITCDEAGEARWEESLERW